MKVTETAIPGVLIIDTDVFGDHRGYFTETYSKPKYEKMGIDVDFVQDNMSFSAAEGTVRGLHWQNPPYAQSKLVSCTKGRVIDVAVDIRKGSPTFGKWVSCELSEDNHRQFFIPQGFAHGFLTLSPDVEFRYKVGNVYNKESEGAIRYDDPTVNVDWGALLDGREAILSDKDRIAPELADSNNQFVYEEMIKD